MIHKNDALAALDQKLRGTEMPEFYSIIDKQARSIVEGLFGDRDGMPRTEAFVSISVLSAALAAMMGARAAALAAGDTDDEGPDATE